MGENEMKPTFVYFSFKSVDTAFCLDFKNIQID